MQHSSPWKRKLCRSPPQSGHTASRCREQRVLHGICKPLLDRRIQSVREQNGCFRSLGVCDLLYPDTAQAGMIILNHQFHYLLHFCPVYGSLRLYKIIWRAEGRRDHRSPQFSQVADQQASLVAASAAFLLAMWPGSRQRTTDFPTL